MTERGVPGLVSVVVASYNHARFLKRRMDSLVRQTYPHIEIIVIDDCSPDNSVHVLREYASHPKVRLIVREQNGGWVAVSNEGFALARGEFVSFANCDDDCDPRMIERLVAGMESHPTAGISYCRSWLTDEHDRVLGDDFTIRERAFRRRCVSDTLISGAEMSRFLLFSCVIPNLSAALFRREAFARAGELSSAYRVCCDWDLFFRVADDYDVWYVADPLNNFRQHGTTIRSSTKERVIVEEYFRLLLGQIRRLQLTALERSRFRTRVMFLWAAHLIAPSLAGARNFGYHLSRAARYDSAAVPFLIPGLALRAGQVAGKLIARAFAPMRGILNT